MTKKNEADTRNAVTELVERRELAEAVHTEPMRVTLGENLSENPEAVAELREQLGDGGREESVDLARARLTRSVTALRTTFRRSAVDLGAALRGTGSCAVGWLRAELGRVRVPGVPSSAVPQT